MEINYHEVGKTMLTITVGFLLGYWFMRIELLLTIAIIIGLIGVLSKYLSIKIDFLWFKLASLLSLIVPNILLGVIFYIILLPLAVFTRFFINKNLLNLKNTNKSLFVSNEKKFSKESFEVPW